MSSSSLTILEVQNSIEGALFQSPNQAAWIKTDKGIVEVVFFLDPAETTHIQITPLSGPTEARHLYQVQAPPPTVTHDVVIDAAYPLYFSVERGMYMVTNSVELHAVLKRILAEH